MRLLNSIVFSIALACPLAAVADDAKKPPAEHEHPPTHRLDSATPTMKPSDTTGNKGAEHAPTNRMNELVPPMKSDDPPQATDQSSPANNNSNNKEKSR